MITPEQWGVMDAFWSAAWPEAETDAIASMDRFGWIDRAAAGLGTDREDVLRCLREAKRRWPQGVLT